MSTSNHLGVEGEPRNRNVNMDETIEPKPIHSFYVDKPLGNILEEINDSFNASEFQNPFGTQQESQNQSYAPKTSSLRSGNSSIISVKSASISFLRLVFTFLFLILALFSTTVIMDKAGKVKYMDCIEHICTKDNKFNYNKFTWLSIKRSNLKNCFTSTHNCAWNKNGGKKGVIELDDIDISYMRKVAPGYKNKNKQ